MVCGNRHGTRKRKFPDLNRSNCVDTVRQRNWIATGRRGDANNPRLEDQPVGTIIGRYDSAPLCTLKSCINALEIEQQLSSGPGPADEKLRALPIRRVSAAS